jgi:hypothetical protein
MPNKKTNICDFFITNTNIAHLSHSPQSLSINGGLYRLVRQQRLTECLDWIEQNYGITGDVAIFFLRLMMGGTR